MELYISATENDTIKTDIEFYVGMVVCRRIQHLQGAVIENPIKFSAKNRLEGEVQRISLSTEMPIRPNI